MDASYEKALCNYLLLQLRLWGLCEMRLYTKQKKKIVRCLRTAKENQETYNCVLRN